MSDLCAEEFLQWCAVFGIPTGGSGPSGDVTKAQVQQSAFNFQTAGGADDAFVVNLSPPVTSLTDGLLVTMSSGSLTNLTTSPTLQINALTPVPIKTYAGTIAPGDIAASSSYIFIYNAALDRFELINPTITGADTFAVQTNAYNTGIDSGVANAYVVSLNPAPPSIVNTLWINLIISHANTGASTLTVNGDTKSIVQANGNALIAGQLALHQLAQLIYSSSFDAFILMNPSILDMPLIDQINDINNHPIVNLLPSPGAPVNYWQFANAQSTFDPTMNVVGSDTNISMNFNAKGAGNIFLTNETNTVISIFSGVASAVNYLTFENNTTGNSPQIVSFGADTDVGLVFNTKGNGVYEFFGNSAFIVSMTPHTSAVNYIDFSNSITANPPNITATGSDTNIGIYLNAKGSGAVVIANENRTPIIQAQGFASAVNNIQIENAITGSGPNINALGSDTNVAMNLNTKGVGEFDFYAGGLKILSLTPNALAVNNLQIQNAITGGSPEINCQGSDSNISMVFNAKGASGGFYYYVDGLLSINVVGQASAVNYLTIQNATTGFGPNIYAAGSDTNVNLNLIPQGSGIVKANSGIATVPHASAAASLTLGAAYQNTAAYDVVVTVYLNITAATGASIALGVGSTNTPTQQTILGSFSTTGLISIPIYIPAGYYALLSDSGTITASIIGQITMAV